MGVSINFFQTNYEELRLLTTLTFMTHLWKETSKIGLSLVPTVNQGWVPAFQGKQDAYMMELASGSWAGPAELSMIKVC